MRDGYTNHDVILRSAKRDEGSAFFLLNEDFKSTSPLRNLSALCGEFFSRQETI